MKYIVTFFAFVLVASFGYCIFLTDENGKLKTNIVALNNATKKAENAFILKLDSSSNIIDSLMLLKSKTAIINHFKIVEKQKLVTITDSTKEPIIFNPEYQLLNCLYDSVNQENSLNNRLVEAQSHYILTLYDRVDSFKLLNSSLSVDNKILQHKVKTYRFITATGSILLLTVLLL